MPTIPEDLSVHAPSSWEINFMLLQDYLLSHGQLRGDVLEFWMLTSSTKLNQWLVYNKVELRKERNQNDPVWMDRKQRLLDLGIYFDQVFRLTDNNNLAESEPVWQHTCSKRSRNGNLRIKKDQEWIGWMRTETEEEYFEYIPKMSRCGVKQLKKVPQFWLPDSVSSLGRVSSKAELKPEHDAYGYFSQCISLAAKQIVAIAA